MVRDLARLANEAFDVLVIGGGIYGLTTLRELTARGLRAALVDRGDFGAATSFNSLKTVHGGIRALQHGALPTMREFVRARRDLASIAPHLVRPLPFVVPTYRHPVRNRPMMAAFLAVYDLLALDRNDGIDARLALPSSHTVSRAECLRLNPFIDPSGVTGGAIWHDYQLHNPERLAIGLLSDAVRQGAVAANYTEARQFTQSDGETRVVRLRDVVSGAEFDARCRVVVNAAGPWAWPLLEQLGVAPASIARPGMSIAMNLVVNRPPPSHATGGVVDGRFLFLVPWRDRSIVGTSHGRFDGSPESLTVTDERLEGFLREIDGAFPRAGLTRQDVTLVHRGLLPATDTGDLLKHSIVHDHERDGTKGLVTIVGVRYTTATTTAVAAARHVATKLGRPSGSVTPTLEPIADSHPGAVAQLLRDRPALSTVLSPTCHVTRAEIVHAVRNEMAIHLPDALIRRTSAGVAGHPGFEAARSAAAVMADELRWTPEQVAREIAAVDAAYQIAAGHPP